MRKGKANTAHLLRFPGDWFHVFGIGRHSVGFTIRIEVKTGSNVSEVVIGPNNRVGTSNDDLLRVNLIGDYAGYSDVPSFDNFYLVISRQADWNRINRNQVPLYDVQGRFERINEQPNAGSHSFSIGIPEVLNSNLLIELRADDIQYVYQKSNGTIVTITVPTFQALTQFGVATITTNNTGKVEASYSITFDCSGGISPMEEQFFIMKPTEIVTRSFKLLPSSDQAAKYMCVADRAECQFTTTATVLDNGTQLPFEFPKSGVKGFFETVEDWWHAIWDGLVNFITGKSCRKKCSGFFDFRCHIRYICMSWLLLFGLFLAIFPTVVALIWLLHENGLFDPFYDWWEDHFWDDERKVQHMRKHGMDNKPSKKKPRHHADGPHKREKHKQDRTKREKHKHDRNKDSSMKQRPLYVDKSEEDNIVGETRHKHKHQHAKRRT